MHIHVYYADISIHLYVVYIEATSTGYDIRPHNPIIPLEISHNYPLVVIPMLKIGHNYPLVVITMLKIKNLKC